MLKKKGLAAMLIAGALIVGNTFPVLAANTADTTFRFSAGTSYTESTAREKTNTTSVYVKLDATRTSAQIMVYGYTPNSSGTMYWINQTVNSTYVTARPGVASSIRSNVYERGGRSAQLRGRSVSGTSITGGVWSPDSTKTYTVLN